MTNLYPLEIKFFVNNKINNSCGYPHLGFGAFRRVNGLGLVQLRFHVTLALGMRLHRIRLPSDAGQNIIRYEFTVLANSKPRNRIYTYWLSGRAGRENIWPEVMAYGPNAARSVRHDRGPNIFR